MKVTSSKLHDAVLLEPIVHGDNRGFFMESYNEQVMLQKGLNYQFIQDNQSLSAQPGVLRGLHYQLDPRDQTKLIRVIAGAIYDVILDIRKESPTYGHWEAFILSEYNYRQLLVPKGFAHGFCTLVPNTQVLYKVDEYYSPEHDRGILWNDPSLGIDWPTSNPILSEKDTKQPLFKDAEMNF
ncbi:MULTISPECIES: dTDP-4-dehydrorhamnose 3,5-epimerase [Paenibacillus]|uniref:dTDP-4-dehydrorhamnose 3,5-epimerase n=1 Tax=Paenibacillus TaxID=44249 RepID=UPI000B80E582|nr:dTDP-4-dehydrorhamnose 3,5-epimerase [Paenibacillus amylolyticus]